MRHFGITLIIILLTLVYGAVNYYIFLARGWKLLAEINNFWRWTYIIICVILTSSFVLGRILERTGNGYLPAGLMFIGSLWLAVIFYGFLSSVLFDLFNLLVRIFKPALLRSPLPDNGWQLRVFLGTAGLIILTVIFGYINALNVRVKQLEIDIPKVAGNLKGLNITLVSDIHLGTIVGNRRLSSIIDKINATDPDLVILAGDIVDEDIGPVIRQDMGEKLTGIKSHYGVIGITGNHEYIGGAAKAIEYLEAHGINMLVDDKIQIEQSIWLVGRKDCSGARFDGSDRKPLTELLSGTDRNQPLILLDHQPVNLNEAVDNGIDLQLSGHTHHGQLWPLNYLTGMIYEKSWGYYKKSSTQFYISSGAGTWGPPVRIGNQPEIVNIKLKFKS